MEWEQISDYEQRAMVPGGWLVKSFTDVIHKTDDMGYQPGWDYRIAMAFVPDPDHEWII
jgi:hypothetical protein